MKMIFVVVERKAVLKIREHKYKAKCLDIKNIFDNPELLEVK